LNPAAAEIKPMARLAANAVRQPGGFLPAELSGFLGDVIRSRWRWLFQVALLSGVAQLLVVSQLSQFQRNDALENQKQIMKIQRFAIGLTVLNLFILMSVLFRANSATTPDLPPVLRVRGLELMDDQGRVRAMLKVFPANPTVKMPDGTTGYPETVLFRLIDSKGAPNVKISATEDGSGMSLGGESNPTHVQVLARGTSTSLTLVNKDGRQQVIKPQ
jgi:hypothetical protein